MIDFKEDMEYDLQTMDEVNDRAAKLLQARIKQQIIIQEGVTNGETDID